MSGPLASHLGDLLRGRLDECGATGHAGALPALCPVPVTTSRLSPCFLPTTWEKGYILGPGSSFFSKAVILRHFETIPQGEIPGCGQHTHPSDAAEKKRAGLPDPGHTLCCMFTWFRGWGIRCYPSNKQASLYLLKRSLYLLKRKLE